jgi:hypothetical protein
MLFSFNALMQYYRLLSLETMDFTKVFFMIVQLLFVLTFYFELVCFTTLPTISGASPPRDPSVGVSAPGLAILCIPQYQLH